MSARVRIPLTEAFRRAFQERDRGLPEAPGPRGDAERTLNGRRSVGRASISEGDLQRVVSQDLGTLMNTVNMAAGTDLTGHDEVRNSILNFGFPDMLHRSIDEITVNDIGGEIERALLTYEPRLAEGSIGVRRDETVDPDTLRIRFIVAAELDCEPLNLPVQFVADLERDTGKITIRKR